MAYDPETKEPSTARTVATAASETARGIGLGLLATGAVLIGTPTLAYFMGAPVLATITGVAAAAAALLAAPALFGAASITGAIFGFKRGIEKNDTEYARAQDMQKARSILAAQAREIGRAEAYAEMNAPQRSSFMAQAPVYAPAGECPHCKVNTMNYQGQAVALQHGIAS